MTELTVKLFLTVLFRLFNITRSYFWELDVQNPDVADADPRILTRPNNNVSADNIFSSTGSIFAPE